MVNMGATQSSQIAERIYHSSKQQQRLHKSHRRSQHLSQRYSPSSLDSETSSEEDPDRSLEYDQKYQKVFGDVYITNTDRIVKREFLFSCRKKRLHDMTSRKCMSCNQEIGSETNTRNTHKRKAKSPKKWLLSCFHKDADSDGTLYSSSIQEQMKDTTDQKTDVVVTSKSPERNRYCKFNGPQTKRAVYGRGISKSRDETFLKEAYRDEYFVYDENKMRFESPENIQSVRKKSTKFASQENNTAAKLQQIKKCEIFTSATENIVSDKLQNTENTLPDETTVKVGRVFAHNSNQENTFRNEENVEAKTDRKLYESGNRSIDHCVRLDANSDFDEDTERTETPISLNIHSEFDTEALTYLKIPDRNVRNEETKPKNCHCSKTTDNDSFTTMQVLSSGYPWNTSEIDSQEGPSYDIPHSDSSENQHSEKCINIVPSSEKGAPDKITPVQKMTQIMGITYTENTDLKKKTENTSPKSKFENVDDITCGKLGRHIVPTDTQIYWGMVEKPEIGVRSFPDNVVNCNNKIYQAEIQNDNKHVSLLRNSLYRDDKERKQTSLDSYDSGFESYIDEPHTIYERRQADSEKEDQILVEMCLEKTVNDKDMKIESASESNHNVVISDMDLEPFNNKQSILSDHRRFCSGTYSQKNGFIDYPSKPKKEKRISPAKEFHSLPSSARNVFFTTVPSYSTVAFSESDLGHSTDIKGYRHFDRQRDFCNKEVCPIQAHKITSNSKRNTDDDKNVQCQVSTILSADGNDNESNPRKQDTGERRQCKKSDPTKARNERKNRKQAKKRKKHRTQSSITHMSADEAFSSFSLSPIKRKRYVRKKGAKPYLTCWSRKHSSGFSWYRDSGLGATVHSEQNSTQYLTSRGSNSYVVKFLDEKKTQDKKSAKRVSYTVQHKFDLKQMQQKILKNFIKRYQRKIAKSVARELYIATTGTTGQVYGLDSFFNRVSNGLPLSTQERMQYEWLRLASFQNYRGNGNTLTLARNGFFSDHTGDPSSARCYLCNAQRSNWEWSDDVNAEHRRLSPNCPFVTSNGRMSQNIPIRSTDNTGEQLHSENISSTASGAAAASSSLTEAAISETAEKLKKIQLSGDHHASISGGESVSHQPTEDLQSRDRSLLVLPEKHPLRAVGRSGHTYSTVTAPKRNNVAQDARSNAGIYPAGNGLSRSGGSSQLPSLQPTSAHSSLSAPSAFASLSTETQTPVATVKETLEGRNATAAAAGILLSNTGRETTGHGTEGIGNQTGQNTEGRMAGGVSNPVGRITQGRGTAGNADPYTIRVSNPRHSEFVDIERRVESFQGWPNHLDQTATQMAEAGFYFVGVADFTRCYCCGGGLRNWEPGDDPVLEHTRWFPNCEYVKILKGERYVAAVQRRHQEHMAQQHRQQSEHAQRHDENHSPADPMATEAAEVILEMGYTAERTREAILAVRHQTGSSVVNAQQVLTWLLDEEDRRSTTNEDLNIRPPRSTVVNSSVQSPSLVTSTVTITSSSTGTTTSAVGAGTTTSTVSSTSTATKTRSQQTGSPTSTSAVNTSERENQERKSNQTGNKPGQVSKSSSGDVKKAKPSAGSETEIQQTGGNGKTDVSNGGTDSTKINPATKKKKSKKKALEKGAKSISGGTTGGDIDSKSLKAENEKLREMQTCKICMEQPVDTTLLPCGHLVCCESCAARLRRCPICRKIIQGTVKTYMS